MMLVFAMTRFVRHALGAALLVLLAACASTDKPKPEAFEANPARLAIKEAWRVNVGATALPLELRVVGDQLWVASSQGDLVAINASSGAVTSRSGAGATLSAGVGADKEFVAVVTRENQVITLREQKELWRQKLPSLVLTPPLVAGARVFVLAADRTVYAFDALNGRKLWSQQRPGDALLLGQPSVLMAVGATLVVAQGGRLLGLNPQNGSSRWDTVIANGRGVNEVERLADLVSGVSRVGDSVCLRAFQYAVGCVDARTGRLQWTKLASGATGVGGNADLVVGAESDGKVIAWRRSDGDKLWTHEKLRFRGLTGASLAGDAVALGDSEGNVHFLSPADGSLLQRMSVDGSPIVSAPVWVGSTWVVLTQRGNVIGLRP